MRVNYIGSRNDGATFINSDDGLYVQCGCFFGSVDEFISAVKQKHKGTVHEKTYLLAVNIAKVKFGYERE